MQAAGFLLLQVNMLSVIHHQFIILNCYQTYSVDAPLRGLDRYFLIS